MITNLLTNNSRVVAVVGIKLTTGDFPIFKAKTVIIAS
jgi:succinate dehydrogenase/fumarate reductase flavoprotein subunit